MDAAGAANGERLSAFVAVKRLSTRNRYGGTTGQNERAPAAPARGCGRYLAAALAAGLTSCVGVPEPTPAETASELSPEAQLIVAKVLEHTKMRELCAGGTEVLKKEVRRSTVRLMFVDAIDKPRESGTEAGLFLAERCEQVRQRS